ncbi:MAG: LPS-assembly protein LptD [Rhodobacteraceae bacterium]|nr:LPS-assembly protein LptD [Paracoccaceae bacterium]
MNQKICLPALLVATCCWVNEAAATEQCYATQFPGSNSFATGTAGVTEISADQSETFGEDIIEMRGHVDVRRDGTQITSETLRYNQRLNEVDAQGAVVLRDADMVIEGSSLQMNLLSDAGAIENANYALREKRARGKAVRIIRHAAGRLDLENASFTTCPPGRQDWQLLADKFTLDQEAGVGTARNMTVRFKGLPIFYTPYASFPISEERKTGFLAPTYGSSSDDGTELATPFYWNIAPNYDALITPRVLEKRGLLTEVSFRHLLKKNSGITNLAYLPSDDLTGEDRKAFFWTLNGSATSRLSYNVDYNYVSDDEYFEDFGDDLTSTSITHLRRQVTARYAGQGWNLRANFEGYQTLSGTRPYQRLPQISFFTDGQLADGLLEYELNAETTWFDSDTVVDGSRVDLYPKLSLRHERPAYYVEPTLGLRYTRYDLNDQAAGLDDSPDRFTPIVSLDSGLFFERDVDLWGLGLLHTLEPRAFYLYVPERDHRDIPRFDTNEQDINFSRLFTSNRFSGADRQGDANQLTLALTTRMLSSGGSELLKASLGQIIYFEDREVRLVNATPADNDSTSEYVAELNARLSRNLSTRASWQWDPDLEASTKTAINFSYRRDDRHIVNLGYRSRIKNLEQTDLSVAWPIAGDWSFIGRSNYSLREKKSLDSFAGFEYDSCCWALRIVSRHWAKDIAGDMNHALMMQIELKGLTSLGNPVRDLLVDGILGYPLDNDFAPARRRSP